MKAQAFICLTCRPILLFLPKIVQNFGHNLTLLGLTPGTNLAGLITQA